MLTDGADYVTGAVKLGRSIHAHTTVPLDLVVMELKSKPLSKPAWKLLRSAGWQRCVVERIAPLDEEGTFGRFRDQFTKLHAWGMTIYKTLLYLDSDTLVLHSIDNLLRVDLGAKKLGVARDFGAGKWRPTFNMGVFLIHPNRTEYKRLRRLQLDPSITFNHGMCEQGFLNVIYKNQWHDIGFVNNANLAIYSQKRSFWDEHVSRVNIVHYTMSKPWKCSHEYATPCSWWGTECDWSAPYHEQHVDYVMCQIDDNGGPEAEDRCDVEQRLPPRCWDQFWKKHEKERNFCRGSYCNTREECSRCLA